MTYFVNKFTNHAIPGTVLVLATELVISHSVNFISKVHFARDFVENVNAKSSKHSVLLHHIRLFLLKHVKKSIENVGGIFVVLVGGLILAVIVSVIEFIYYAKKNSSKINVSTLWLTILTKRK